MRHVFRGLEVVKPQGVSAVSLQECVLECLCRTPFEFGLGIIDSALRLRKVSLEGIQAYVDDMGRGRKGISRARFALRYADARAENGGESRARAVMIEEGYAPHELQVRIPDPLDPYHIMRGDLGWQLEDGTWIIGELDGKVKYVDPAMLHGGTIEDVMRAERQRESRMSVYGVRIMRFTWQDVSDRWSLILLMQAFGVPRSEIPAIP